MAKEVLKITSTKSGDRITTTINDVNPEATNAQLAQLGTKFNALTSNTYEESNRVTTINVDTEPGGGAKPTPTLTLSQSSIALADVSAIGTSPAITPRISITTNSDGTPYIRYATTGTSSDQFYYIVMTGANEFTPLKGANASTAQTIYVGVTETASYKGVEVAFNITV